MIELNHSRHIANYSDRLLAKIQKRGESCDVFICYKENTPYGVAKPTFRRRRPFGPPDARIFGRWIMDKSILIIEDDPIIRRELKSLLEKHRYEVVSVEDIADTELGLPKNTQLILLARVETPTKRGGGGGGRFFEYDGLSLDSEKGEVCLGGSVAVLTKNELRILCVLMENEGRIVSREKLMHVLWQTEAFVDDNTLTVNINRLRKKLETIGARNAVKTRRGLGYSL
jgi:DNA-binding response OmpR family regulator